MGWGGVGGRTGWDVVRWEPVSHSLPCSFSITPECQRLATSRPSSSPPHTPHPHHLTPLILTTSHPSSSPPHAPQPSWAVLWQGAGGFGVGRAHGKVEPKVVREDLQRRRCGSTFASRYASRYASRHASRYTSRYASLVDPLPAGHICSSRRSYGLEAACMQSTNLGQLIVPTANPTPALTTATTATPIAAANTAAPTVNPIAAATTTATAAATTATAATTGAAAATTTTAR